MMRWSFKQPSYPLTFSEDMLCLYPITLQKNNFVSLASHGVPNKKYFKLLSDAYTNSNWNKSRGLK